MTLLCAAEASALDRIDPDLYSQLLARYTQTSPDTAGTRVDYQGLRSEPGWHQLVSQVAASGPEGLSSRQERLAFWINAYNILAIQTVVAHYPVDSIKDAGSLFRPVWDREAARIGEQSISLGEIEHQILRPMGDPRVHAAIVCASTSCPSLARSAYRADTVDRQLDDAVRRWLASPAKGLHIDRSAERVTLSKIFDWFEDDFQPQGGVLAFVGRYVGRDDASWLVAHSRSADIEHFEYDWSLNDAARTATQ